MSNLDQITELRSGWKTRPINGFEKYFFVHMRTIHGAAAIPKIDPARSIYPRDAMGNLRAPLGTRRVRIRTSPPFYLPQYTLVKPSSPKWTIKPVSRAKEASHYSGAMFYDRVNDKSQLPWTQVGRPSIYSEQPASSRCRSLTGCDPNR